MQISSAQRRAAYRAPRDWVRRLAQFGYAIKGVVYGVMAILALQVAFGVRRKLAGEHEAVEHIGRQPFGNVLLVVVGAGLLGYALWRVVEAVLDPHAEGTGWKGIAIRLGALGSAVVNGGAAVAALRLATANGGHGENPKVQAATVLNEPWGLAVLALLGLTIVGVAVAQFYSAYRQTFLKYLSLRRASAQQANWLRWTGRIGLAARGVVFGIIGVALVRTALTTDPNQAKGLKEALHQVAAQPFGQALLTVVAAGLLAYAVHLVATVPYRRLEC
jgi:hypothetical protein